MGLKLGASGKPPATFIRDPRCLSGQPGVTHTGSGSEDLPETSVGLAPPTSGAGAQAAVLTLSDPRLPLSKAEIVPALPASQGFENCRD